MRKTLFEKNHLDETETSAHHSVRKRDNIAHNVSQELNSENVLVATVVNNLDLGEKVSKSTAKGQPLHQRKVSSCPETPLHNCTILFPTWRSRVCPNLWTGVQRESKMRLIGCHPMTSQNLKDDTSEPKHHDFVGLILGQARGLTDTGVRSLWVNLSCSMVARTTSQATRSGGCGCDTGQHDSRVRVLDFPA